MLREAIALVLHRATTRHPFVCREEHGALTIHARLQMSASRAERKQLPS